MLPNARSHSLPSGRHNSGRFAMQFQRAPQPASPIALRSPHVVLGRLVTLLDRLDLALGLGGRHLARDDPGALDDGVDRAGIGARVLA